LGVVDTRVARQSSLDPSAYVAIDRPGSAAQYVCARVQTLMIAITAQTTRITQRIAPKPPPPSIGEAPATISASTPTEPNRTARWSSGRVSTVSRLLR